MNVSVRTVAAAVAVSVSFGAFVSCRGYDRNVREALFYAGDNRTELEKVIEHYSRSESDTLKLKAALRLIGDMTYHRSYPAELYGEYCREVDSLFLLRESADTTQKKLEAISSRYESGMDPVPDVRVATADYLIWNIDYSFIQWETSPFLRHLDFEQFCEYVLPYKCVDFQPLSRWKEDYADKSRGEMDTFWQIMECRTNVRRAVDTSQSELKDSMDVVWKSVDCIPLLDFIPLMHMQFGTCIERSVLGVLNSRSKSLPVSMDMTPSWPDHSGVHHWNNVFTDKRRNIDFEPFKNYPGYLHYADNTHAKIYRYKFAPNPVFVDALKKEGCLQGELNNIFLHDVTNEYCKTSDVSLRLDSAAKGADYAYLCVFNNYEWTPVALSKVRRGRVSFDDLGLGVVYLPVIYRGGIQIPAGNPFLLTTRRQKVELESDHETLTDMRLLRKYPAFYHIYSVRRFLRQGTIEASDNPGFLNARIMAEFPDNHYLAGEETVSDTSAFRYWRIVCSHEKSSDFAELYFYEKGTGKRLSSKIIPSGAPVRNPYYDTPEHICDGNPLSYFATESEERWVGFDFGRLVSVGEIAYIRRGDGNDVCPGQHYEFYYWDNGRWTLHGDKTAERVYLDFEDVPSGGLYYLKCTTSGVQQRIFMYENGKQIWY